MKKIFLVFFFMLIPVLTNAEVYVFTTKDKKTFEWHEYSDTGSHYCSRQNGSSVDPEGNLLMSCIAKSNIHSMRKRQRDGTEVDVLNKNTNYSARNKIRQSDDLSIEKRPSEKKPYTESRGKKLKTSDVKSLLVGTWQTQMVINGIHFSVENIVFPDGTFKNVSHLSDGRVLYAEGTWKVSGKKLTWITEKHNIPWHPPDKEDEDTILVINENRLVVKEEKDKPFITNWKKID